MAPEATYFFALTAYVVHVRSDISATLNAQHQTFVTLAGKTAAVEAEMQKIKAFYTQAWRARTGSVRDPFNDVVKPEPVGDFGLSGLNVR
jgi:nucleoporin p58/p45